LDEPARRDARHKSELWSRPPLNAERAVGVEQVVHIQRHAEPPCATELEALLRADVEHLQRVDLPAAARLDAQHLRRDAAACRSAELHGALPVLSAADVVIGRAEDAVAE